MKQPVTLIILSLMIFLLSCTKSATVTIVGVVDSANGTLVRVTNNNYTKVYDSTVIKNNKFTLHPTVPKNGFYSLDFNSQTINGNAWGHGCLVYIKNKVNYKFTASGPAKILYNRYNIQSASFDQRKLNEFNKLNLLKRDSLIYKKKYYASLADDALSSNYKRLYNSYIDTVRMLDELIYLSYRVSICEFIKKNPKTVVTPYLICEVSDLFENYAFYKNVLDKLSPVVKSSKEYDEANGLLQSVKNIHVGAQAPAVSGKDINGNSLNFDYKKKKITLIDFWASYCGPCREQVPELKQLYNQYKAKGLEIVSVSIDEDSKKWHYASKIDHLPWYNISELKEQEDSKNIRNFVVKSIPSNYLVNSEGKFIGKDVSLDSIKRIMGFNKKKT